MGAPARPGHAALPQGPNGRQPIGLERMLRIYFLQEWFNLSDPQAEDAIYDSESMRRFAGVELGEDTIPDETTILHLRHLLERHQLAQATFAEIRGLLEEKRLLLKAGTIVDATIIAAPSSTKNATATRDPEMKQTKKRKQWHFGMKLLVSTDTQPSPSRPHDAIPRHLVRDGTILKTRSDDRERAARWRGEV